MAGAKKTTAKKTPAKKSLFLQNLWEDYNGKETSLQSG